MRGRAGEGRCRIEDIHVSLMYMEFSSSLFPVNQHTPDQLALELPPVVFHRSSAGAESERVGASERPFPIERRRTRRAAVNAPVQLDAAERSLIGVCSDISLGGMFFLGPVLPVSEKVSLTMEFPALGRVRIPGEVLAHRHHPKGSGMAIRFSRLAQSDLAIITRFVAERLS